MYKEDLVQKAIVNYLKVKGFLFTSPAGGLIHSWKTQRVANSLGYKTGCGDLIVFIPNGCLHIEVKRPKILAYSTKTKKNDTTGPWRETRRLTKRISGFRGENTRPLLFGGI